MSYQHTARFVPVGESFSSATNHREVQLLSENFRPAEQEVKNARSHFYDRTDSYAARNYWELYDFITTYEPESNLSSTGSLVSFLKEQDWSDKVVRKDGRKVSYIDVRVKESSSVSDALDAVDEYRNDDTKILVDNSSGETRLHYKWHTLSSEY